MKGVVVAWGEGCGVQFDLRFIKWGRAEYRDDRRYLEEGHRDVYVELDEMKEVRNPEKIFIWGRRGCGKTAIAQRLAEEASQSRRSIQVVIDFREDQRWISPIVSYVAALEAVANFPRTTFLQAAWYRAIILDLGAQLRCKRKLWGDEERQDEDEDSPVPSEERKGPIPVLESVLARASQEIEQAAEGSVFRSGATNAGVCLSPKTIKSLEQRVEGAEKGRRETREILEEIKRSRALKITVIADSLDEILDLHADPNINSQFHALCLVVRSLMRAMLKLHVELSSSRKRSSREVDIKVLLPKDMELPLHDRATQQETTYNYELGWTAAELAQLVARRIGRGVKSIIETPRLDNTWATVIPAYVRDPNTRLQHNSFEYILRHTQYRPRELLVLCERFSESARKRQKGSLTESEICQEVTQHCLEEAKRIIQEFSLAYPQLHEVMRRLSGANAVLDEDELYKRLGRVEPPPGLTDPKDILAFLYDMGMLGAVLREFEIAEYLKACTPYTSHNQATYHFVFRHYAPGDRMPPAKQFALHPIFHYQLDAQHPVRQIPVCHKEPHRSQG